MKFGQHLLDSIFSEWSYYYVDYNKLKKNLNKTKISKENFNETDESEFVDLLDSELNKLEEIKNRLKRTEKQVETIISQIVSPPSSFSTAILDSNEILAKEADEEINKIIEEVNNIAKFGRLNYTSTLKIVKKHDKRTKYVLKPMFILRLEKLEFLKINETIDELLLKLSELYEKIRNITEKNNKAKSSEVYYSPIVNLTDVNRTTKYWVHTENVMHIKLYILKYFPVLMYNEKGNQGGRNNMKKSDSMINTVYLDNDKLELYYDLLESKKSSSYNLRWYGKNDHILYMEYKKRNTNDGSEAVDKQANTSKYQFPIKKKYVKDYLAGNDVIYNVLKKANVVKNSSEETKNGLKQTIVDVQKAITEKELKPMLRTVYNRTVFQMPEDTNIKIILDTDISMILEGKAHNGEDWCRTDLEESPFDGINENEITRFPYAILEIIAKPKVDELNNSTIELPKWIDNLSQNDMVQPVPNFSKYVHGMSVLLENKVSSLPFWLPQLDKGIQNLVQTENATNLEIRNSNGISNNLGSKIKEANKKSGTKRKESKSLEQGLAYSSTTTNNPSNNNSQASKNFLHRLNILKRAIPSFNSTTTQRIALPVRVEPKVFFANERTFLSWANFLILLSGMSITLTNFGDKIGYISGIIFSFVSIAGMAYALYIFQWRAYKIRNREAGPYDDLIGPIVLVGLVSVTMLLNFWLKFNYSLKE